jgi:hypothetical protein
MEHRHNSFQSAFRPRRRWSPRRRRRSTFRRARRQAGELPYSRKDTLLTRGETAFFEPLKAAIGQDFLIMCKVRLADIVRCTESDWRRGFGGAISQKHLDFVLCDPKTTRILMAIELDDRSHEAAHRRQRDRFVDRVLSESGVRLVRFRAQATYSVPDIRERIRQAEVRSRPAEHRFCGSRQFFHYATRRPDGAITPSTGGDSRTLIAQG